MGASTYGVGAFLFKNTIPHPICEFNRNFPNRSEFCGFGGRSASIPSINRTLPTTTLSLTGGTDHKRAPASSQREGFTQKIGNTTYDVSFHYSTRSSESANDKIIRLIENEILHQKLAKYYLTYEDRKGCAKERFYDKYAAEIDRATTYRVGMLNMCRKMELPEKIAPKHWNKELADLKAEDAALSARYGEICSCLETLEQIQQEVASVYRSRQAEQNRETTAEREQRRSEQKKRREESL